MSPAELGWLAGIIEGEGCFPRSDKPCGRLRVAMTDRDIIERLHEVTGLGLVHDRGRRDDRHKQVWDWTVLRRENMCAVAQVLAPLFLQRRRQQIAFIFRAADIDMPPADSPTPGHPTAWGWVAGLIEGEGWIMPAPGATRQALSVNVQSTDMDVVERLRELTGVGSVHAVARVRPRESPTWTWRVSNRRDTCHVLEAIHPMLGERRRVRADYALSIGAATRRRAAVPTRSA
jgi:hypothetical protein